MRQYLDLTTWVVLFALLPITVLILLSQNSIPGDLFYPVKRGLENIILVAASVSPSTKVAFRTDLTQRRFTEAQQLLVTKADTTAFTDFVSEVQSTQQDLSTLSSSQDKIQNADKILAKIDEYQNQLTQVQSQVQIAQSLPVVQPSQNQPIQNQPTQLPSSVTQPLQSQTPAVTPTSANPNPSPQPQQPVQGQQPPTTTSVTQTSAPASVAGGNPAPVASPIAPAPLAPSVTNTIANNPQKAEEVKQSIDTTKNELAKIKEEVQKNKEDAQVQEKIKEEQKKLQENLKKEHEQTPNPSSGQ